MKSSAGCQAGMGVGRTALTGFAIIVCLGLVLGGCAGPDKGPKVLTADEIRQAVTRTPLTRCGSVLLGQWRYTGRHSRDGTMSAVVLAGAKREDATGSWHVTGDDLYCRTWNNDWAEGREGCFRVTRSGDALTFDHVGGAPGEATSYTYGLGDACG